MLQFHAFFFINFRLIGDWKATLILFFMYTLNFPNGSSQTYPTYSSLCSAARALGGDIKLVGPNLYVFVAKK